MEQGTSEGTRGVRRWRGHCQQRRMAGVAAGDEGMKVGNMDPQGRTWIRGSRGWTMGYRSADRRGRSGQAARRRRCQPV